MDVKELKKAVECCIKMDCVQCPLGTVIGCDQKLAEEVMAYIDGLEERLSIMQESMEALEKRNEPIKPTLNESHSYVSDAFKCGKCGHTIRFHAKYCEECGQAVAWND